MVPIIDVLDDLEPSPVVDGPGELNKPGPHVVRGPFRYPDSDFRLALYGIFPPVRLFQTDTEYPAQGLHAHRRAKLFRPLAVRPGRNDAASRLMVGEEDIRQRSGNDLIGKPVGNIPRSGFDGSDRPVPTKPQFSQTVNSPLHVLSVNGILTIACSRQGHLGKGFEIPNAMLTVAGSMTRPAIGEYSIHLVQRHDLLMNLRHEIKIVGAERAGDP